MRDHDDEQTAFEHNPFGARQRLLPTQTFLSRVRVRAETVEPAVWPDGSSLFDRLTPELYVPRMEIPVAIPVFHRPVIHAAVRVVAPRRSIPRRWIAAVLGVALGVGLGFAVPIDRIEQSPSISLGIAAGHEAVAPAAELITANEPAVAIVEEPVIARPARPRIATRRPVVVNTGTALGDLRPRRSW